jgi:hypothetical protein
MKRGAIFAIASTPRFYAILRLIQRPLAHEFLKETGKFAIALG